MLFYIETLNNNFTPIKFRYLGLIKPHCAGNIVESGVLSGSKVGKFSKIGEVVAAGNFTFIWGIEKPINFSSSEMK